jgi:outer membrane receptor protein involved in Fe transport
MMVRQPHFAKLVFSFLVAPLIAAAFLQPAKVFAQSDLALEEIVVTAQRREQSFVDVPVAIEVFSGELIRQQGFRDLDDLANFSPSVLIESRVQDQDVAIRGVGTTGNTLTHDQAAPFFLDGIHFGRQSQSKLAFLDIESLEVLKGPQPVYFGMNATAGAFNIRSKRPGDSWEGYINAELANNTTGEFTFGIGGPINDQWGIRVAGMHESTDGYMDYVVTGDSIGSYESNGGRILLTFEPTDKLSFMAKADVIRIDKDGEAEYTCLTDGPILFGRDGPLDDPGEMPGNEASVWNQETGTPWAQPFNALDTDCFSSNASVSTGGPWLDPIEEIRCYSCDDGFVDFRSAADGFTKSEGGKGIDGYERLEGVNTVFEVAYAFDNGMSLEWLSGTSTYKRDYALDNRAGAFLTNFQNRNEDFSQWSTELRLRSSGDQRIEWEIGAFAQHTELDAFSSSLRANLRQSQRFNTIREEVDFASVFANVTININDRWALDIGGRYQDADKDNSVKGYSASWVFAVCPEEPCDPGLTPVDVVWDPALDDGDGAYAGCEGSLVNGRGRNDDYCLVDPNSIRFFGGTGAADPGTQYYAMPWRETRYVPDAWSHGTAVPVGLTAIDYNRRQFDRGEGPWAENFQEDGFSPQVSLRFQMSDDISLYARYAESFKIGGFDTGQSSIPRSRDELAFDTEDAEHMELGIKGALIDGRMSFSAAIFETEFPNLQVSVLSTDPDQTSASGNAGQRVRGFEFDMRYAVSENWILGFAGALLDGEMTRFPGAGCTDAEVSAAINNGAAPCKLYDDDFNIIVPGDAEEAFDLTAIIDRTGLDAPRTPDWKFIFSADFAMPVFGGNYELMGNAKAFISDGYIVDVEGFSETIGYDQHEDMNVMLGIRNIDGGWSISAFARNIFEARPTYRPEFDPFPNGTITAQKMEYVFD